MTATDTLFSFLTKMSLQKKIPVDTILPTDLDFELSGSEMTSPEIESTKIHIILLKLIPALLSKGGKSDSADSSVNIDDFISQLEAWLSDIRSTLSSPSQTLINITPSSSVPSWLYLHKAYSTLETLKAIILFASFASKPKAPASITNLTKENLDSLKKQAVSVVETIKDQTVALKKQLSGSGMLGNLVNLITTGPGFHEEKDEQEHSGPEGALAKQIEELIGIASLELFCGSVMESWDGALDGVLSVCGTLIV